MTYKNIKTSFALLCAAALLVATSAEALIHKMVVLRRKTNGTEYYIYGLGEYHAEDPILKSPDATKPDEQEARKLKQLTDRLTALTISQGDALSAYITQLPKDQCIFINEDMLAYNGNDEVIKGRLRNHRARLEPLGLGINGFLAYVTQLSKLKSWQCINAECRYFDLLKDTSKREELFQSTIKKINNDIDQSDALPIIKGYSKKWLETLKDTSAASLSGPGAGIKNGRLVDAKIPLLIWEHQHIKHIVLMFGSGHIKDLLPLLNKIGYTEILSEENVVQLNPTAIDLRFLNSIPLDLKKLFDKCLSIRMGQSKAAESKQVETNNNNTAAQSSLFSGLLAQPIADNNKVVAASTKHACGICAKEGTKKCSQCKAVYYCSSECQIKDWKNGHKLSCAPKTIDNAK